MSSRQYHQQYYQKNKYWVRSRMSASLKRRRIRNRQVKNRYLTKHPCVDCGESDIRVLEFDHVNDDKLAHVADMCRDAVPVNQLIEEMQKCEVRCANCHRIRHAVENGTDFGLPEDHQRGLFDALEAQETMPAPRLPSSDT